jgi:methylated-DNA-[protein]-cysteine S-methyltransferase
MAGRGFALFDTPLGCCGVAWGARGLIGVQLPEGDRRRTRARLRDRFGDAREAAPPAAVQRAIRGIVAVLRGERVDLSGVRLDMEGVPPFHRRVYQAARAIEPGRTLSYGELATRLGAPGSARAVGQAMGRNPFAVVVPCHRVLGAGGKVGGFSANGGATTKLRMLAIEGVEPHGARRSSGMPAGGLGFDPQGAVKHLRATDPVLGRLIDAVGPLRIELTTTRSIFGALAQAIVYQQLSGKAAETIYRRVCGLSGSIRSGPSAERILALSDATLRGAGLSRAKVLALRDLAAKTTAGAIPSLAKVRRMEDEAIVDCLTAVRGIGRWTVEMLLIFRLGRPDVLPVGDYGVRKGFGIAFGTRALPTPKALASHGERWRPYRTAASWYLWRALELGGT